MLSIMKKTVVFLVGLIVVFQIEALSPALKRFVEIPAFAGANIGLEIKALQSGKVLAEYRSGASLIPASNMKLVTTATVLELAGPDYCFETPLEYDGTIDKQGVLHGNIHLIGTGDPTIGSEVFNDHDFISRWVDAVRQAGIKSVMGQVVANVAAYDKEVISPDWTWQNLGNYFAAGVFGLAVYDNMYYLQFRTGAPGTTPQILGTMPPMYELTFQNRLKAGQTGDDDDDGYLHGAPFSNERTITGTIPANRDLFSIKGDIPNPPFKLAEVLTAKLNEAGITVSGSPKVDDVDRSSYTRFFVHRSPSLADIIKETNMQSNNLFAEHLFKWMGLQGNQVATRDAAAAVVSDFWKTRGADVSFLFQHDGCGLSPMNGVPAHFFVQLLTYMRMQSKYKDAFYASLPVAGQSGTLKRFLAGTALAGKIHAKSGSIRRVVCYSGYAVLEGKECAFSIMVNNYAGSATNARKAIENLLLCYR